MPITQEEFVKRDAKRKRDREYYQRNKGAEIKRHQAIREADKMIYDSEGIYDQKEYDLRKLLFSQLTERKPRWLV